MIDSLAALRSLYAAPRERSQRKQLPSLDAHCKRFIALSPFVVVASSGASGMLDASPRGGAPGFVQVIGDSILLIPDSPGNNRLDTMGNIVETGQIGLLFIVPGVDETLRVNGSATLSTREDWLQLTGTEVRRPKLVIAVDVKEAYLHCAKAFMRSELWNPERHVDRASLPSMGEMLKQQIGLDGPAETQEEMLVRYRDTL